MIKRANVQIQVLKCSCLSSYSFEPKLLFQLDNFFQKPLELKVCKLFEISLLQLPEHALGTVLEWRGLLED